MISDLISIKSSGKYKNKKIKRGNLRDKVLGTLDRGP